MKDKIYYFLLLFTALGYSQVNDSIKTVEIEEVFISLKSSNKAGEYKLNIPKKILENETLDKTIKRVDFITVDNSKNIYFKGKKISNIFYNDRLITIEEFNKLNIEDVRNMYIVSNNFNQSTGEIETVIKITENKKTFNNIKGSVDFSQGFFQKFNYYGLSLNNKINKLSSRLNIANVVNETKNSGEQIINSDFIGIDNKRNLSQPFFSLQNIFDINDSTSVYMNNRYSIVDEAISSKFSNLNELDYGLLIKNYTLNLGFDKKLKNDFSLRLQLDYINTDNKVESELLNTNQVLFSKRKFDEITFSPLVQKRGNKYQITNSVVVTNRKFNFNNTDNTSKANQNIITYFANYSLSINQANSIVLGARYQFEENDVQNKKNHHFLPNLIYLIQLDSLTEVEFSYRRKAQRPSINSISNSVYFDSNGNEIINQDFINTQIDNLFSLEVYRKFRKFNVSIALNYDFSKNYISGLYGFNNQNMLFYTTDNIDKFYSKSIRTSLSFPLWEDSKVNLNYSISDIKFELDNDEKTGLINTYDVSVSGALFKKYLVSVNSSYIDKFYEYNAFLKATPDFSVSVSKNYLKDKLNLNVEFRNILDNDTNRKISFSENSNYYYQSNHNQSRLFLISLTYNFGKEFRMSRKHIQNNNSDMKLK